MNEKIAAALIWAKNIAIVGLSIIAPIKTVLIATIALVFFDMIVGVIAAWKRKEPITSAGFRRTIVKLFVFETALIIGFIVQKYMLQDSMPLTNMLAAVIGLTEGKSVLENLDAIYGGSLFADLIKKLGSKNDQ